MDFFALLVLLIPALISGVLFILFRKKIKAVAYLFLGLALILGLSVLSMWIPEVSGRQLSKRFDQIQFFQRNMPPIPKINTPAWEYWVLAQSNLVQALETYAVKYPEKDSIASILVSEITHKMVGEEQFPFKKYPKRWPNQALYLSHLNIVLATYQRMNQDDSYADLNKKISNYLSKEIIVSPYKNIHTAGKNEGYFPSENAVILEGLRLTDEVQNTHFLQRTQQDWTRFISRELLFDNTKLPCTNFDKTDKCKLLPQSTYLCWMTSYIYHVDEDFSKQIWHQTKFFFKESPLLLWANFDRYHPDDIPPAYGKNNPRPLEVLQPNIIAKVTAAALRNRVTYFQLNNLFQLKIFFQGHPVITTENYWEQALNTVLHFKAEVY